MILSHRHLIFHADVCRNNFTEKKFNLMFDTLLKLSCMKELIPRSFAFSHQKAWSGIMGIVTSHMSFHFFTKEKYVQFDLYSCKEFNAKLVVDYLKLFWKTKNENIIFIEREVGLEYKIKKIK